MIKPDCYLQSGKIINLIEEAGFTIGNVKMVRLTQAEAEKFYEEHRGKAFFRGLVEFVSSDLVVGLELIADNGVGRWRELRGDADPNKARLEQPGSVRALFGEGGVRLTSPNFSAPYAIYRRCDSNSLPHRCSIIR